MARFFAGILACFLLMTGAFLLWQGKAENAPALPAAPANASPAPFLASNVTLPRPPEASPKSREQQRFSRADKNKDGRITTAELFEPRRKAFAKLDANGDGTLSFEEWAAKTVQKFGKADQDRSGWLSAAEYATTAPKPRKQPACACG